MGMENWDFYRTVILEELGNERLPITYIDLLALQECSSEHAEPDAVHRVIYEGKRGPVHLEYRDLAELALWLTHMAIDLPKVVVVRTPCMGTDTDFNINVSTVKDRFLRWIQEKRQAMASDDSR